MAAPEPDTDPERPLSLGSGAYLAPDPRRAELRRWRLTVTGLALVLAFVIGAYVLLEKAQAYDPTVAGGRVVLYAVLSLNIVLILAITVTLLRNAFKLLFEWRQDLLGSRFSTKLVLALMVQAVVPTALLFVAGSELIRVTSARWFSTDVAQVTEAALRIARTHREQLDRVDLDAAGAVAAELAAEGALGLERRGELPRLLQQKLVAHRLGGLTVALPGQAPVEVLDPTLLPLRLPPIPDAFLMRWQRGERFVRQHELAEGRGVLRWAGAPVASPDGDVSGVVVVSSPADPALARDEAAVTAAREEYVRREISKGFIVATNVSILLLVTLLLLLAALWLGLVMARGITQPIQRLAEGTREVAAGNLDHRVSVPAADELRILVDSFNRMTSDLKSSKVALEETVAQLSRSNEELLERRRFIETVLHAVAAGVLTFDKDARLTTCNPTAVRALRLVGDAVGRPAAEVLGDGALQPLQELLSATLAGGGTREAQLAVPPSRVLQALATPLTSALDGSVVGAVLVVEDVSELVRAQKTTAWREVARRMAHEIKNPLTPIQLSAERMILKADRMPDDVAAPVRDGARMILDEVRTLKGLVDEFSRFARLPEVTLREGQVNDVVRAAVALYDNAVPASRFRLELDAGMPEIPLDAEQLKRAVVNLVDNALAAMGSEGAVTLRTAHDRTRGRVLLEVADEGPGIPVPDRARLFHPHFSTKKRGTGLGLAIVDRVVADHGGYIRVEDNAPRGARFVIEIPFQPGPARRAA